MKTKGSWVYYLLLTFSAIFWGSSFIFTKHLLNIASPAVIVFSRLAISVTIFMSICLLFYRRDMKIDRQDLKTIIAFSFFEPFLYFICETYSLTYCDASIVSIIVATIPIATAFLSIFYFKENFTWLNLIGVATTVVGITIMIFPSLASASMSAKGVIWAFSAVFASVGYTFFVRKLPEKYNPVVVVTYQNLTGLVLFTPLIFITTKNGELAQQLSNLFFTSTIIYIVLLAIFCSTLAFMFYLIGIRRFGIGKSTIFTNFIPIVTAILSFFLLKESFPWYKVLGIVTVIGGIFLVQKKKEVRG